MSTRTALKRSNRRVFENKQMGLSGGEVVSEVIDSVESGTI